MEHSVLNGSSSSNASSQSSGKRSREDCKSQRDGGHQGDSVLQTLQDNGTHKLTDTMAACTSLCRSKSGGAQTVSRGSWYYLLSPTKTLSPVDRQRKNQCSTIESLWVYKAHFWVCPWPQSKLNGNFGNVLSHIFGLYLSLETFGLYIIGSHFVLLWVLFCVHPFWCY